MFYTEERCKEVWDEEKKNSHLGDTYKDIDSWGVYWSYIAEKYPDGSIGCRKKIVDFLEAEGIVKEGKTVLDVGCGPGTYALSFLQRGMDFAECVDSTEGMLKELWKRAEQLGLKEKIRTSLAAWDAFSGEDRYDLVFSSMSPAISEYSELMKMETYSRKHCCLVTYGANMPGTIRGKVWEIFLGKKAQSMIFDAIYPFNILYAMGRNPDMKTFCEYGEREVPVSKAIEDTICYFRIFGRDREQDIAVIEKKILENSIDGVIREDISGCFSVIHWMVPQVMR